MWCLTTIIKLSYISWIHFSLTFEIMSSWSINIRLWYLYFTHKEKKSKLKIFMIRVFKIKSLEIIIYIIVKLNKNKYQNSNLKK